MLLPVFPLQVVLFPRTEIPLHIFEERYKEMIGECIEARSEFGIVLVIEQGVASTGCTAVVAQVFRKFDDGRMDILASGRRRFEMLRLDQERSYLRSEVQFFDDETDAPASDLLRHQALTLYLQLAERLSEKPPPPETDDPQLSFQIASRLPVELRFRQGLLQIRSETDRLRRLISHLERMAAQAVRSSDAQVKAGSNGKAR